MTWKKSWKRFVASTKEIPRDVLEEGLASGFLEDYEEAIERFERVEYIDYGYSQTKASARYYKGQALSELGKHEEAVSVLKQYLEKEKDDGNGWLSLGTVYMELEKFNEASDCYQKALKISPKEPNIWAIRADPLIELKKFEEGLECCEKALNLDPNNSLALINRGGIYTEQGKFEKAIEDFQKHVKLEPDSADALQVVGTSYLLKDDLEEAIKWIEKGLKIDPTDEISWYNKACVLSLMNKKEEACDALLVATSIEPENLVRMRDEKDFDNIKNSECFKKLLNQPV